MKRLLFLPLLLLLISGCYSPEVNVWDELTIKEGKHASKPYDLTWNDNTVIAYRWEFTESCQYELDGNDQCDWNKLTGYSFDFFTNHKNSLIVAWRWDVSGFWWVAPYYHKDSDVFWTDATCSTQEIEGLSVDPDLIPVAVYPGQTFETHFNIRADLNACFVTILVPGTESSSFYQLDLPHDNDYGNTREIYPWFGGNQVAPHEMVIKRLLIDIE